MTALTDKFSKLDHFHRQAQRLALNLTDDIKHNKNIVNEQIEAFGDKEKHIKMLDIIANLEEAQDNFNKYSKELQDSIYKTLRRREIRLIQESYQRYEQMNEDKDFLLVRNSLLNEGFVHQMQNQLSKYAEWKYPGVDINPLDGTFTQKMLACDPLYCIAEDKPIAKATKANFTTFFGTRRLRTYNEIRKLPKKQFGVVCSINQFEYMPLDPIKDIVSDVIKLMRPGGVFIFSYNDCGQRESLEMLSNDWRCYGTKGLMLSLVESVGFEYVDDGCIAGTHSWIVVKAPGELSSIRTGVGGVRLMAKEGEILMVNNVSNEQKAENLAMSLLQEEKEKKEREKELSLLQDEMAKVRAKAEEQRILLEQEQEDAKQKEQERRDAIQAKGQQLIHYNFEDLNENLAKFLEEIRPKDMEGYYGDLWMRHIENYDPLLIPGNVGIGGQGLADKSSSTIPSLIPGYRKKIKNAIKNYFDTRGIF